jgi:hypothetical protein
MLIWQDDNSYIPKLKANLIRINSNCQLAPLEIATYLKGAKWINCRIRDETNIL